MASLSPLKIFLLAGEPSGDALGGEVMKALRTQSRQPLEFAGIGGPAMRSQGLESLANLDDLAVMGLTEVLQHLPRLLHLLRRTTRAALDFGPDIFLSIDSPSFGLRVARRLHRRGAAFPLVHLVAPQVWAWKPWRAREMAGYLDHLLALLPFEPPLFQRYGLDTTFIGHPAARTVSSGKTRSESLALLGLPTAKEGSTLCLLPGSRAMEVTRLLPVYRETLIRLRQEVPDLQCLLPSVPTVAGIVRGMTGDWPLPIRVVEGKEAKQAAFALSDAALAASGTVAVELAAAGVPAVITYKVSALSAALARRLLKVRYVSLINLMGDREIQPELLQENATPDRLAERLLPLLREPSARLSQLSQAAPVLESLRGPSGDPAGLAGDLLLRLAGAAGGEPR